MQIMKYAIKKANKDRPFFFPKRPDFVNKSRLIWSFSKNAFIACPSLNTLKCNIDHILTSHNICNEDLLSLKDWFYICNETSILQISFKILVIAKYFLAIIMKY